MVTIQTELEGACQVCFDGVDTCVAQVSHNEVSNARRNQSKPCAHEFHDAGTMQSEFMLGMSITQCVKCGERSLNMLNAA